jgi:hypothetical protein
VGKLEEKLDGLVSLIKSTQDIRSSQTAEPGQQLRSDISPLNMMTPFDNRGTHSTVVSSLQEQAGWKTSISQNGQSPPNFVPIRQAPSLTSGPGITRYPNSDQIASNSFMPTFFEGDTLLDIFRDQLTPQFPFIVLPDSVSANNLYNERPFFYLCIVAVTSRDTVQQQGLGKLVMKQLATRVFEKSERNLDLLLGALTYTAWFVHHILVM